MLLNKLIMFKYSKIIFLFLFINIISSCINKKIINGQLPEKSLIKTLKVGKDKKDLIISILGSPTFHGQLNDNSIYYAEVISEQFAFLDPDIKNQNVIQLEFDKDNILKNVYLFGVSDKNEIVMSQRNTETFGREISFLEQIISNIGLPGLGRGPIIGSGKADK